MLLYSIADKIVFNILKRINIGFLEITTFSGKVLKFGNPNDKLKANLKILNPINLQIYELCLCFLLLIQLNQTNY